LLEDDPEQLDGLSSLLTELCYESVFPFQLSADRFLLSASTLLSP